MLGRIMIGIMREYNNSVVDDIEIDEVYNDIIQGNEGENKD